jgi:hypothetical protein
MIIVCLYYVLIVDKSPLIHNYGYYYERYLKSYRDVVNLKYLELGILNGDSLRFFRAYFPNAELLVGIDKNPDAMRQSDPSSGIHVEIGSQIDTHFLDMVNAKYGPFDVILDDCSHITDYTIASFEHLFPLLNDKGVYIIEDVASMKDVLAYFHQLTYYLNKARSDYGGDFVVDPWKINIKVFNKLEYSIGDIIFSNSCIIIFKDVKYHWIVDDESEARYWHIPSLLLQRPDVLHYPVIKNKPE